MIHAKMLTCCQCSVIIYRPH